MYELKRELAGWLTPSTQCPDALGLNRVVMFTTNKAKD